MPTANDLIRLLSVPNESLTLEYKSWLDLGANHGKATLAKAAIALCNEGGGIIILGMRAAENAQLGSQPRPEGIARYNQDAVNAAINRYADPQIHCEVMFALHPVSGVEHAFVIVPGGMTVPVMSTRDHQGEIMAQRCYVRKPGPRSEEPFTAEEWRGVFERCLQARREDMLHAIRLIVQGHSAPAPQEEHNALQQFCAQAEERWHQLTAELPADDPARMPRGYYRLCFEIIGVEPVSLAVLRQRMAEAGQIRLTGWGPFVALTRQDLTPRVVNDAIEAWLGNPGPERVGGRDVHHCDFWRADGSDRLFLQRGYDEDGSERVQPGSSFDVTLPVWRVGEAMLYVARLARQFADNPQILVRVEYTGLGGRELVSLERRIILDEGRTSADDQYRGETQASAGEIEDNVVEILHELLSPLYERFDFFDLPLALVTREIERMRRNRF